MYDKFILSFTQEDVVKGPMNQQTVISVEVGNENINWSAKELRELYYECITEHLFAGKGKDGKRTWKAVNINLGRKFDVSIKVMDSDNTPEFTAKNVSVQHITKELNTLLKMAIKPRISE